MREYRNDKPLFVQLREQFVQNIANGKWPIHSKLKDEIQMARDLRVSRGTLRKTIKSLVDMGVLSQIKGKGTFVVSTAIEQPLASRFVSFSEAMKEKGLSFNTILVSRQLMKPDHAVSAFLEVPKGEQVILIERVRLVNNYPVIYMKNYIRIIQCPGLMEDDLENEALFSLIENKYNHKIDWGRRSFRAIAALGNVAFNLGIEAGAPVMYLEQTAYTVRNEPLEHSHVWINSEKFEITSVIQR